MWRVHTHRMVALAWCPHTSDGGSGMLALMLFAGVYQLQFGRGPGLCGWHHRWGPAGGPMCGCRIPVLRQVMKRVDQTLHKRTQMGTIYDRCT